MYAGHIGVALGARGIRVAVPLWVLVIASQLPDWADAGLCLAGTRPAIPGMYSHSLPAVTLLATAAAIGYFIISKNGSAAALVAAVVISHALGDYVTGIKPTWPGGPLIGLQLYRQPALDFLLESAVILGGWLLYRRTLPPERRSSRVALSLLFAVLAIQLAADIFFSISPTLRKC